MRNASTGQVEAKAVYLSSTKTCTIIGTATRPGYGNAVSGDISINLAAGTQGNITWSAFPATGQVGTSTAALAEPVSSPTGASFAYLASGGCTISNSRVITFNSVSNCSVTVTSTLTGYAVKANLFSVTGVTKGTQSAPTAWNAYAANLAVGAAAISASTTGAPTGEGALRYRVLPADSNYCTVTAAGQVTARAHADIPQDCEVQAEFRGNANYRASGYATIDTVRIVAGTIVGAAWAGYGSGGTANQATVGTDTTLTPNAPTATTAGVTWTYSTTSANTICTVASDGILTVQGAGNCVVKAVPSKTGYAHAGVSQTVVIAAAALPDQGSMFGVPSPAVDKWAFPQRP